MRWLLLLISGVPCMATPINPLPEIETGTSGEVMEITETHWYAGFISASIAVLVGEVGEASSDVRTTPQQTVLSETCELRVEAAFGHLEQIQGIRWAKLRAVHENSPYEPVDPDWGRLRHLKKGRKILLLLHAYEGGPCFGSEALIELTEATRTLPDILRRTAFNPHQFTDEDLRVVEAASPFLHRQLVMERPVWREIEAEKSSEASHAGKRGAAAIAAALLVTCLLLVGARRRAVRR